MNRTAPFSSQVATRPIMQSAIRFGRRFAICATAVLIAGGLTVPPAAYADVSIDGNALNQGANSVGGGTATLTESVLDMVNVVADSLHSDEDLTINFNGGNEIDNVAVDGSASVEMNFAGENEVEDVYASGNANVTINANGHNEFDDVVVGDNVSLAINVTGENTFDNIEGVGNANITVRGTTCQKRDIITLGDDDDDDALIITASGNLTIDHATVLLKATEAYVGSAMGNVVVDTSKIAKDDCNEYAWITAGGTMDVRESVIDISGSVHSAGKMTINHSDVKATKPDPKFYDFSPYRVFSETGIDLIREKNGEVKQGSYEGRNVWYVDTGDGEDVDLKADGTPGYYSCGTTKATSMPKTGDEANSAALAVIATCALTVALAARRRGVFGMQ